MIKLCQFKILDFCRLCLFGGALMLLTYLLPAHFSVRHRRVGLPFLFRWGDKESKKLHSLYIYCCLTKSQLQVLLQPVTLQCYIPGLLIGFLDLSGVLTFGIQGSLFHGLNRAIQEATVQTRKFKILIPYSKTSKLCKRAFISCGKREWKPTGKESAVLGFPCTPVSRRVLISQGHKLQCLKRFALRLAQTE